jgi:hypothetical protein
VSSRHLWRIALVAILSLALSCNTNADSLKSNADHIIIGVVAAVAVVVVVVAVLVHQSSKKKTVTGCVVAAQNGMSVTDEKDKRVYTLSGDTTGVKTRRAHGLARENHQAERRQPAYLGNDGSRQGFGRLSALTCSLSEESSVEWPLARALWEKTKF